MFPRGFLFQNHYPRFTGAPSSFFKGCPQGRPSVDSGLGVSPGDFFEMTDRLADLVRDDKGKGVGAVVVAIVGAVVGAIIGTFVSLIVGTWVFYGDPIPNIVLIVSSIGGAIIGAIGGLITRD